MDDTVRRRALFKIILLRLTRDDEYHYNSRTE